MILNDCKPVGTIWVTENYSIFKRLEHNRSVTNARKEKLIASMSVHEVLCPIIVNKNMEIIDGQGRYEAKKEMGLPIYFIIDENADISDCQRMNATNSKWTMLDFVQSYASAGNVNYINLLKVCAMTKQPLFRTFKLAMGTGEPGKKKGYADGSLVFTQKEVELIKEINKKGNELLEALCFPGRPNDTFFAAVKVLTLTEGYNHKRMLINCKKCRASYCQMSGMESQLKEFSRIYNYAAKSNKIYFEDYMRNKGYNVRSYDTDDLTNINERDISTLEPVKEVGKHGNH